MRRISLAGLVSWLLIGFVSAPVLADEPAAAPVKKEDLRYDGKPFGYWRDYLRTELKGECRLEALKAMTAFGANGYGKEVAETIVDIFPSLDMALDRILHTVILTSSDVDKDIDLRIAQTAIETLHGVGAYAVPPLLRALRGNNRTACLFAAATLSGGMPLPETAARELISAIESDNVNTRDAAICVTASKLETPFAGVLLSALRDDRDTQHLVQALLACFRGKSEGEVDPRERAAKVLGYLGPRARVAIPVLQQVIKGQDSELRQAAEEALKKIAPPKQKAP